MKLYILYCNHEILKQETDLRLRSGRPETMAEFAAEP